MNTTFNFDTSARLYIFRVNEMKVVNIGSDTTNAWFVYAHKMHFFSVVGKIEFLIQF